MKLIYSQALLLISTVNRRFKKSMQGNTTMIIVVVVLALHFLVGIGWLLYKMAGPKKPDNDS
ncbi:MAG: hypothetical protein NXH89_14560 [Cyclobacteriaceae bacterium]|nr:hypothetical protein [Cyclobacteriaceae bacterium]